MILPVLNSIILNTGSALTGNIVSESISSDKISIEIINKQEITGSFILISDNSYLLANDDTIIKYK